MELRVIAEGVKTTSSLNCCAKFGCDDFQGFRSAARAPAEEFSPLVLNGKTLADIGTKPNNELGWRTSVENWPNTCRMSRYCPRSHWQRPVPTAAGKITVKHCRITLPNDMGLIIEASGIPKRWIATHTYGKTAENK